MSKASGPIARVIRQAVKARKVSRYRVAKDSGVDFTALSKFLAGKASLKLESVEQLAEYLGLELKPKSDSEVVGNEKQPGKAKVEASRKRRGGHRPA